MGVKISALPVIATPAYTDVFPVVQGGVTFKESFTQLQSLFATSGANSNITSLTGLSTPLSVAQGGTGSATGNPTFVSVTFSPTTGGIVGTPTNDNASSGKVGEFFQVQVLYASAIALTSTVVANVAVLPLPAGDFDVWGNVGFNGGATTVVGQLLAWISATSATLPDRSLAINMGWNPSNAIFAVSQPTFQVPYFRASLAAPANIYLSALAVFATSTCTAFGGIYARRAR